MRLLLLFCSLLSVLASEDGIEFIQEQTEEEKLSEALALKEKKEQETIIYTCIVLTRIHLSNFGEELLTIVKNQPTPDDQQNVWKKMYSSHVRECTQLINYEESVQILDQIKSHQFDYKRLPAIYSKIDFNKFRDGSWLREFSDEENSIWIFVEEFESQLAEDNQKRKQERQDADDFDDLEYLKFAAAQTHAQSKQKYEHKLQKTNFSDILFLVLTLSSIILGIYLVVRKLQVSADQEKKQKKLKK